MVDTLLDKKGVEILLLDLRDEAAFTDYFLICSGESDRQLQALVDGVSEDAKVKANAPPWGMEGKASAGWVLLDFGDVIVHLFSPEKRSYYNLEQLWGNSHVILRMQ